MASSRGYATGTYTGVKGLFVRIILLYEPCSMAPEIYTFATTTFPPALRNLSLGWLSGGEGREGKGKEGKAGEDTEAFEVVGSSSIGVELCRATVIHKLMCISYRQGENRYGRESAQVCNEVGRRAGERARKKRNY